MYDPGENRSRLTGKFGYLLVFALTAARVNVALAGGTLQLVPDRIGPYLPGTELRVAVTLVLDQPRTDGVRLVRLDFSQTDQSIQLLAYDFGTFYSGLVVDALYQSFGTSFGSSGNRVYSLYTNPTFTPGFIVVPNGNRVALGEVIINVGQNEGTLVLSVVNSDAVTPDDGARVEFGMGCTDLTLGVSDLTGGQMAIVVDTCSTDADCDDLNPCTSDFCDLTFGCLHEPIAGCAGVPTTSDWGLLILALVGLVTGSIRFRAGFAA